MHNLLPFLHRWQWLVAAVVAAVPTVYYAPRKAIETWEWYVHRFRDEPLLRVMRDCKMVPAHLHSAQESNVAILKEGSYSVGDLSHILKRSHPSIGKSVQRLRARGDIELYRGGFRLKR